MLREIMRAKIHRATVTEANLHYVGSITIDAQLMAAADLYEYEKVLVVNVDNGQRFTTYAMAGENDSGIICLNGAAARLVLPGDKVIIIAFASLSPEELVDFSPRIVLVDGNNKIIEG